MRLKELRKERNLKQQDIASLLSCSQSVYSRYESGEYELSNNALVTLASFYGVTSDYILERDSVTDLSTSASESNLDDAIIREAKKIQDPRIKEDILAYIRFRLAETQ